MHRLGLVVAVIALAGCRQAYETNGRSTVNDRGDASRVGEVTQTPVMGRRAEPGAATSGQGAATRAGVPIGTLVQQHGTVAQVSGNTLALEVPGQGQVGLRIEPGTEIWLNGQPTVAAALRPGDSAEVSFLTGRAYPAARQIHALRGQR